MDWEPKFFLIQSIFGGILYKCLASFSGSGRKLVPTITVVSCISWCTCCSDRSISAEEDRTGEKPGEKGGGLPTRDFGNGFVFFFHRGKEVDYKIPFTEQNICKGSMYTIVFK